MRKLLELPLIFLALLWYILMDDTPYENSDEQLWKGNHD